MDDFMEKILKEANPARAHHRSAFQPARASSHKRQKAWIPVAASNYDVLALVSHYFWSGFFCPLFVTARQVDTSVDL